jgi:hypothetical protein
MVLIDLAESIADLKSLYNVEAARLSILVG